MASAKSVTITDCTGMRVEVLREDDTLLFIARLKVIREGLGELERLSDVQAEISDNIFPARLRGFLVPQNQTVILSGTLVRSGGQNRYWMVVDLRITKLDIGRLHRRQGASVRGEVAEAEEGASEECTVGNISAGGLSIQCPQRFALGDKLWVRVILKKPWDKRRLPCLIRRVSERGNGDFDYGCQFVDLDAGQERQVIKSIIELRLIQMDQEEPNAFFSISPPPF